MKYRVRLDLSFDDPADANVLMDYAKTLTEKRAVSINLGAKNEEISFVSSEICYHDEGNKACTPMERIEARVSKVIEAPVDAPVDEVIP